MAENTDMDNLLEDFEQRLKCHYVHPSCEHPLPAPTRLTRYLLPTSLEVVGIHMPHAPIQLLLVANITPKTLWGEVEEAFEGSAYKATVVKTRTHPTSPVTEKGAKMSILLVEAHGHVILLEYCQVRAVGETIDIHGRIREPEPSTQPQGSTAHSDYPLLNGARKLQRIAADHDRKSDSDVESWRQHAHRWLQCAYDHGMLSRRLQTLDPEQVLEAAQWFGGEISEADMISNLWSKFSQRSPIMSEDPWRVASPCGGLEAFLRKQQNCMVIKVNYWAPGSTRLFSDAFFDVVATLSDDLGKEGRMFGTVWPFYLLDEAEEDGTVMYIMGVQFESNLIMDGAVDEDGETIDRIFGTEKVYDVARDLLGHNYRLGRNNDENQCYIQSSYATDDFFLRANEYLQVPVAPVRGLSLSSLPRVPGEALDGPADVHHQTTGETADPSANFRTGKQVLDQLRWDPKYAGTRNFEVGYEDRFVDELLWLRIEDWIQTTEEEEFIPLHRIRQYRNIATKEVVWDRAMRIDKLK